MDDYSGYVDLAVKVFMAIGAFAGTIALVRQKKADGDVGDGIAEAKQASAKVYIEQLADSRTELVRLRAERDRDAELARDREAELRGINDAARQQFSASLDEFRTTLRDRDERIGILIEDVAEQRGRCDGLQNQIVDLQAAFARQKADDAEAKRALVSGKELEIRALKAEIAKQQRHIDEQRHTIADQARTLRDNGLDPNITGIMGDMPR